MINLNLPNRFSWFGASSHHVQNQSINPIAIYAMRFTIISTYGMKYSRGYCCNDLMKPHGATIQ
ncbi:MAG: hypothetical protein RCG15_03985 [Candidatus Rickettsia vulgarisii]